VEEEDAVLNTVPVILDSINWLIFIIIQGGKKGKEGIRTSSYEGLCMPYLEVCFPQHPLPNTADVLSPSVFVLGQMYVSAWVTSKFTGKWRVQFSPTTSVHSCPRDSTHLLERRQSDIPGEERRGGRARGAAAGCQNRRMVDI